MKKRKQFIRLLSIASLLFAVATACEKHGDFPSAGTVKDADGNKYNTVKIGDQVWMVENLKTTKYNDGKPIPNVVDHDEWSDLQTGTYCKYYTVESNAEIYGRLYNGFAVLTGKLAPKGWHVPTDEDWTTLENYLIDNKYDYDGTVGENKIAKALCAETNWELSNEAGTPGAAPENNNSTGFIALPGGRRTWEYYWTYDSSNFVGRKGFWWSSVDRPFVQYRSLSYNGKDLVRGYCYIVDGLSVRLVKD